MSKRKSKLGIISLAYSDSENEHDEEEEDEEEASDGSQNQVDSSETPAEQQAAATPEPPTIYYEDVYGDVDMTVEHFNRSLFGLPADQVQIPPATKKQCAEALQTKITNFYEKVKMGNDFNKIIQKRKDFRNPSIYEKLISYCEIDEMGTNYPVDIFDPEPFLAKESFYEELARLQKEEIDKKEKERKENASKRPSSHSSTHQPEKKSKWDSGGATSTSNLVADAKARLQTIVQQQAAQMNKPKVITAFGVVSKKK